MAVVSIDTRHRRKYVCFLRSCAQISESAHSSQNMVPHHLRASTGSYHDFYTIGRENSVETNTRKPLLKGIWKPFPYPLSPIQILVSVGKKEGVVSLGKKKGDVVSDGRKKEEAVSDDRNKEEVASDGRKKEGVVDRGTQTDIKDHSSNKRPSSDTKSCLAKSKTSLGKTKTATLKPSTYTNIPSSHNKSSRRKLELSSKKNGSSGNRTSLLKRDLSSDKKSPSADPEIVQSVFFPYNEVADSVKQVSSSDNKVSRSVKKTASMVKHDSIPVQLKPVKVKPTSSSYDLGVRGKGRTNSNGETGRKLMKSKASAMKILAPRLPMSKLSLNKTAQVKPSRLGNFKIASSVKDQSRIRRISNLEKVVSEKPLQIINTENGNDVSEYISGNNAFSSSPTSPSFPSHEEESKESEVAASVKEINNKTMRKTRILGPEDKHASPVKAKFRTRKAVELQSDNNTPRKLRLSGGAEDNKGELRRKTSKGDGVNSDKPNTGQSSQKVVLKHQNVQGKKDGRGLSNNVIEETASELAVSRKSKVKALVGAFETVISLQEIKPSTQVVS